MDAPREIEVSAAPDGNLEIGGQMYRETEPLGFERIEMNDPAATAGRRVAFYPDGSGQVTHLITQSGVYRRETWLESYHGRALVLSAATMIFLSALVLWPITALVRLGFAGAQSPAKPTNRTAAIFTRVARGTALATGVLALWFEISFTLAKMRLKPFVDFYGIPAPVSHLLWALPVLAILTLALAAFSIFAWHRRIWHPAHRLHFTLLTAAGGLVVYVYYVQHLLFVG